MGIMYIAINTLDNNKPYIGKSIDTLAMRQIKHRYDVNHGSKLYFHNAVRKYGWGAFEWSILEELPNDQLDGAEQFWISYNNFFKLPHYNLTLGGGGTYGYKHTPEHRAKNSAAKKGHTPWNKGMPMRDEARKRLSAARRKMNEEGWVSPNKGRLVSEETKAKVRAAKKGKHYPRIAEAMRGSTPWNKGKKMGPAWNKGVPFSEEVRAKMAASGRVKIFSEQHRANIGAAGAKTYNIRLTAPDGTTYGPITYLAKFAREHGLNPNSLRNAVWNKQARCLDWSIEYGMD